MNERLWEIYEQICLVEMRGLDEFLRRVKGGEFGDFSRDDVIAFLREIEANMLDNIQTKAMEHHVYAEMAEEVSEQTQRMFDELIEKLYPSWSGQGICFRLIFWWAPPVSRPQRQQPPQ